MIPTVEQSLTLIKSALAIVPLKHWDERVALCLAVQTIEKELSSPSLPAPPQPAKS